jgi:hypothetical protein
MDGQDTEIVLDDGGRHVSAYLRFDRPVLLTV